MKQSFPRDASLVLIGMRCVGKSSLASLAAKNLRWQVVDEKLQFQKATGLSVAGYIEKHGVKAYCAREVQILRSILSNNKRGRIIICSSSCVETQAGRELLQQYLSEVPIVHVMRDAHVLKTQLEGKWNGDIEKLLRSQEPVYFACSNLTFFNTDDIGPDLDTAATPGTVFEAVTSASERPSPRSLSLKNVESDLNRFLGCIYGRPHQEYSIGGREVEGFNYALTLSFGDFKHPNVDLETVTSCSDVLHVNVNTLLEAYLANGPSDQRWWEYIVDQLAFLRRRTTQPILYHVAPLASDEASSRPDYFDLLGLGLRIGAEFISIDLEHDKNRLASFTRHRGHYEFIGWLHDPIPEETGGWAGHNRLSWYEKAAQLGCNMVHLTQPAITLADNDLASWFSQTIGLKGLLPVSAYNTGRLGRLSQCMNKGLTLVRHHEDRTQESEMITVPQAHEAFFATFKYEPLAVLSPGCKYSLEIIEDLIKYDNLGGLGLSAPFKTSIIPKISLLSPEAHAIGAVNTIMPIRYWGTSASPDDFSVALQRHRAGPVQGLYGENTDWRGIHACALRYLSPANTITSHSTALIIGAGGMARAAIYAMIRAGVRKMCIYNRTHWKALELAQNFGTFGKDGAQDEDMDMEQPGAESDGIRIFTLESLNQSWPEGLRFPTVIINCSPIPGDMLTYNASSHLGTKGQQPAVLVPDAWLKSPTGGVYMELAYNRIISSAELLRICAENNSGWVGVAGLEIFLEVASAQFEFWTGRRAPKHLIKQKVDQYLQQMAV